MSSLNKVQIIGNLGQDVELRYTPGGDGVCNVSVATTKKWKDKQTGEYQEATEWHRVSVFGKLAEVCGQYLKKGSKVYFEGELQTKQYKDKEGIERYQTQILGRNMIMLDCKQESQQSQPRQSASPNQSLGGVADLEDDIPF